MNFWRYHANDIDQLDAAAALEERQDAPAPGVNPGDPWHGIPWNPGPKDRVKRPEGDRGKRSDGITRRTPWGRWKDDKEKRQHEPRKEGNPWGPWNGDKE